MRKSNLRELLGEEGIRGEKDNSGNLESRRRSGDTRDIPDTDELCSMPAVATDRTVGFRPRKKT